MSRATRLRGAVKRLLPAGWYERWKYRSLYGRWPSLRQPRLFSERLLRLKLRDRDPLRQQVADKLAIRAFVAAEVGEACLPALHGAWDAADAMDFAALPRRFVLKPTHGSTMVQLVWDLGADDPEVLRALCAGWLRIDYSVQEREWIYRDIPRRILAEELLAAGSERRSADEYRFYVFHGRCWLVQCDRMGGARRSVFDRDLTLLPYPLWGYPPYGPVARPATYEAMLHIAETLGRPFDFIRVDLYDAGDRAVVGELTNFPGGCHRVYEPGLDRYLGDAWASAAATASRMPARAGRTWSGP